MDFLSLQKFLLKSNCATATMTMEMTGTYKTGDDAATPGTAVEGASPIDITVGTFTLAIMAAGDMLDGVNSAESECDVGTVAVGAAFDPSKCTFMSGGDMPTAGEIWYMIYKATETDLPSLLFESVNILISVNLISKDV